MFGGTLQQAVAFWAALSGAVPRLGAGDVPFHPQPVSYHVRRYTTEDGLPHNRIRALLQSHDGYLWAGTVAGLARFDGVMFDVFTADNTPEMRSDAINALAEDRQDGSLWINTGEGLLRLHEHRFERFAEAGGFPHPFGQLWPARDGGLWYSPQPGLLVRLQNGLVQKWLLRAVDVDNVDYLIQQVEEEEAGSVLILMPVGLVRFDPATGAQTRLGLPLGSNRTHQHFVRQTDGTLLVSAQDGLWRGDETGWEQVEAVPPDTGGWPGAIHPAGKDESWIPWEYDGPPRVARWRPGGSEFLDLSTLPHYAMNAFLQDHEGHLWIGTESGLCQLRPKAVRLYAREEGLRNDDVRTVSAGPDGTVWLGTAAGLSGIRDGQITNLPPLRAVELGMVRRPAGGPARPGVVWRLPQQRSRL